MKFPLILIIFFLFSSKVRGQQSAIPCPCCTENHRQFNFWIGEWEVFNLQGQKMGESNITSIQDSCVIVENWSSSRETGTSYNYFDKKDNTWNQVYIGNNGNSTTLKGNFTDYKMVLKSALVQGPKGNHLYNRITWEKHNDGTVSQIWDQLDNRDHLLQTVFYGIYKPKVRR